MQIVETKLSNGILISLAGRLDTNTSTFLEEKLLSRIEANHRFFIIDGTDLDYISSAGLRVLLMISKRLNALNGKIVLSSLKPHVQEIFEIAGFFLIFPVFANRIEAEKSFPSSGSTSFSS